MFPTTLESPYQSRGRRRGRNEPSNRDYICPCGKSYLSYPALFTHIKIKHNGRAPGQVIKPRPENNSRRGRPRAKEVYDSESDTEDIAGNCMDRLCDFVADIERSEDHSRMKEIYMKDDFYHIYASFNPQQQEPKYNEPEDLFEETCHNVFCEFLAEVNKRLNEPYYFDLLFVFFVMLARTVNENTTETGLEQDKKPQSGLQSQSQPIRNIAHLVNRFYITNLPRYREQYCIESNKLFSNPNAARLIEHFFNWLTMKKYLGFKLKINENYAFGHLQ